MIYMSRAADDSSPRLVNCFNSHFTPPRHSQLLHFSLESISNICVLYGFCIFCPIDCMQFLSMQQFPLKIPECPDSICRARPLHVGLVKGTITLNYLYMYLL